MFLISLFVTEYEVMNRDRFVHRSIHLAMNSTNMSY